MPATASYGKGYLYAHDYAEAYVPQDYLPDELRGQGQFYRPTERGYEKIIGERLEQWRRIREANTKKDKS